MRRTEKDPEPEDTSSALFRAGCPTSFTCPEAFIRRELPATGSKKSRGMATSIETQKLSHPQCVCSQTTVIHAFIYTYIYIYIFMLAYILGPKTIKDRKGPLVYTAHHSLFREAWVLRHGHARI